MTFEGGLSLTWYTPRSSAPVVTSGDMVGFGAVSSAFDFAMFGALLLVCHATPEMFRTGWFVESLLTELAIALVVRTRRPFFRSRPGTVLLWSSVVLAGVTLALPYLPFIGVIGLVPLPFSLVVAILTVTALYVGATELLNVWFYPRHDAVGYELFRREIREGRSAEPGSADFSPRS